MGPNRRNFLMASVSTAAVPVFARTLVAEPAPGRVPRRISNNSFDLHFVVNGHERQIVVDPRTTLLDALREHLGLTGTKKGFDHGQCGACPVLVDGRRNLSCLTFAASIQSRDVITIEGIQA